MLFTGEMASKAYRRSNVRYAVPAWLVTALVCFALVTPATAFTGFFDPDTQDCLYAFEVAALVFAHQVVVVSGTIVGPLMGISSVLWLVMRNDAAIEPRSSWR